MDINPLDSDTQASERMEPDEAHPRIFWEHLYRYRFACQYVAGGVVLDIAVGTGYGAALLSGAGASRVLGVDRDPAACRIARDRGRGGTAILLGDAVRIPLADGAIDLLVSFETLEHVPEPERFLGEAHRVLKGGGRLVLSTPNRPVYNDDSAEPNPFHTREFDRSELLDLLGPWNDVRLWSQMPTTPHPTNRDTLASSRSPWWQFRGATRLRRALCRALREPLGESERRTALSQLDDHEPWPARWINPYRVRPEVGDGSEDPCYWIATASKGRPSVGLAT